MENVMKSKKVVKENSYWLRKSVCSVVQKRENNMCIIRVMCHVVYMFGSSHQSMSGTVLFSFSFLQGVCWRRHAATANWVDSSLLASSWQPPCISPCLLYTQQIASQLLVALSACVRILNLNPLVNSMCSFVLLVSLWLAESFLKNIVL